MKIAIYIISLTIFSIKTFGQVSKPLQGIPQIITHKSKIEIIKKRPHKLESYLAAEMYNLSFDRESLGEFKEILIAQEEKIGKSKRPAHGGAYWLILGKYYHNVKVDQAIKYYQKSYDWFERENIKIGQIMAKVAEIEAMKNTISTTSGDTSLIRKQLIETLQWAQEDKAYEMEAIIWNQLGAHYASTENNKELLLTCSKKAEACLNKIKIKSLSNVITLINLSQDYLNTNNIKLSKNKLDEAIFLLKNQVKNNHLNFLCLQNLADIALIENNYSKAELYLLESVSILPKDKFRNLEMGYSRLREFYSNYKIDQKKALYFANLQITISKELFKEKNNKIINELQIKHETEKKDQENKILNEQNKFIKNRNRNYFYLLIFISLILLFLLILGRKLKTKNDLLALANFEIEEFNKTRSYLFGIIAHDLQRPAQAFASASVLMEEFLKNNDWKQMREISYYLSQSAFELQNQTENLLRWALVKKNLRIQNKELFPLSDLIHDVVSVFNLYTRLKNISITTEIESEIPNVYLDRKGLHLVVRNILDNAIKASPENSQVKIIIQQNSTTISIQIQDVGPGIEKSKLDSIKYILSNPFEHEKEFDSIGIGTVVIALFSKQNKINVEIESTLYQGTTYTLFISKNNE